MSEGGTNETTPLIHDGVMFLLSSGNTVQAINAVTGEIIWQNNIGPAPRNLEPGSYNDETRAIGLYNDKVIVPTPQGRLYAPGRQPPARWSGRPGSPIPPSRTRASTATTAA